MYSNEGRLIKGVIYDDVDMETIEKEMFNSIDDRMTMEQAALFENRSIFFGKNNLTAENIKDLINTLDTINSITRYNPENDTTYNLIIPKEALSVGLVRELENVDLGKYLHDNYIRNYVSNQDDSKSDDNNGAEYFFKDKKVSREDFSRLVSSDMLLSDITDLFCSGKVVCF
jgi:hypothetical protein